MKLDRNILLDSLSTRKRQQRISRFKTAYGTFYLPFACALIMLGEKLDDYTDVKDILLEMGSYFQAQVLLCPVPVDGEARKCTVLRSLTYITTGFGQDDFLDCFGDPETIGKIGSDIQDFKCSWLVEKALEVCDAEQKKLLCDNYGKEDPANIGMVKSLYGDLNLQQIFAEYEIEVHGKLVDSIETIPSKSVQSVLKSYLSKNLPKEVGRCPEMSHRRYPRLRHDVSIPFVKQSCAGYFSRSLSSVG